MSCTLSDKAEAVSERTTWRTCGGSSSRIPGPCPAHSPRSPSGKRSTTSPHPRKDSSRRARPPPAIPPPCWPTIGRSAASHGYAAASTASSTFQRANTKTWWWRGYGRKLQPSSRIKRRCRCTDFQIHCRYESISRYPLTGGGDASACRKVSSCTTPTCKTRNGPGSAQCP